MISDQDCVTTMGITKLYLNIANLVILWSLILCTGHIFVAAQNDNIRICRLSFSFAYYSDVIIRFYSDDKIRLVITRQDFSNIYSLIIYWLLCLFVLDISTIIHSDSESGFMLGNITQKSEWQWPLHIITYVRITVNG